MTNDFRYNKFKRVIIFPKNEILQQLLHGILKLKVKNVEGYNIKIELKL